MELINYNLYHKASEIIKKIEDMNVRQMNYIKENYELERNHPYFKTKLITGREPSPKIYTIYDRL